MLLFLLLLLLWLFLLRMNCVHNLFLSFRQKAFPFAMPPMSAFAREGQPLLSSLLFTLAYALGQIFEGFRTDLGLGICWNTTSRNFNALALYYRRCGKLLAMATVAIIRRERSIGSLFLSLNYWALWGIFRATKPKPRAIFHF